MKKNRKVHCCITINSGPDLFQIDPSNLGIDEKEWIKLQKEVLTGLIGENRRNLINFFNDENVEDLIKLYEFLYINDKRDFNDVEEFGKKRVENVLKNYLAISGGADPIVGIQQMQKIAPTYEVKKPNGRIQEVVMAINQLIVAKGDHYPGRETSEWHEVIQQVEKYIVEFINSCGSSHYKRDDLHNNIRYLIEKSGAEHDMRVKFLDPLSPSNYFTTKDLDRILEGLDKENQILFMNYYYRSKAFDPHFHEIVKYIFKRKDRKRKRKTND